jgi:hypothetical protein
MLHPRPHQGYHGLYRLLKVVTETMPPAKPSSRFSAPALLLAS